MTLSKNLHASGPLLVTGASGYIGRALCATAQSRGYEVRGTSRTAEEGSIQHAQAFRVVAGTVAESWSEALEGIDTVIHLAGRAHILREDHNAEATAMFRRANVHTSVALATQAQRAGVRRLIFVSSVGVHGPDSRRGAFRATDTPRPYNVYTQSKWEAEQALRSLCETGPMELVVIRPPLVYGAGASGNFGALVRAVRLGWPLPLARVTHNRRSLVALDNLIELILTCVHHPNATLQPWLVSDNEDVCTATLLRRLALAMRRPARLFPVPVTVLRWGSRLIRRPEVFQRLCGSLQVDIADTVQHLDWQPKISMDEGLRRAVTGELA